MMQMFWRDSSLKFPEALEPSRQLGKEFTGIEIENFLAGFLWSLRRS